MLSLYVVADVIVMVAAFLGADRWPRHRVLLITVGTLAVVAPLAGIVFIAVLFMAGPIHFG